MKENELIWKVDKENKMFFVHFCLDKEMYGDMGGFLVKEEKSLK